MKLASFDIFDTTLIRRCGRPNNIFVLLSRRLFPDDKDLQEAFLFWRCFQAEGDAVKRKRKAEVSILDIYHAIDPSFLNTYTAEQLIQIEKEVEAANLVANPRVRSWIMDKRREGYVIAFISDMYLDNNFLRFILMREGCATAEDKIYVSCECNARKDTGTLYDKVREDLHPSIWVHYGDNRKSDIQKARQKGIQTSEVSTGYTPTETLLERIGINNLRENGLAILTGLSRAQRLMQNNDPFVSMAADFVAPAYLPYVMFILQQARQAHIQRLYFLSRDSYVLMCAALATSSLFPEIECRYLFVSRRSLCLPYLSNGDIGRYLDIVDHRTVVRKKVDALLLQLGTSRKELEEQFGITFSYSQIENEAEGKDFLQKIFRSPFTVLLQQRAHEQERLVRDYFMQEGLLDEDVRCAAVDVGWLGTSRLMINSLMRRWGARDLDFFYYGIRRDVLPVSAGKYLAYFPQGQLSTAATGLVENYFSASPYPTTIGYSENEKGKIEPIFPVGQTYKMTSIVNANVEALEQMASELVRFQLTDEHELYLWAKHSLDILTTRDIDIDLTALQKCADFDTEPFVKRLSISELCCLVLLGKQVTAFDWASLRMTLPRSCWNSVWKIRTLTGRIRAYLFRKIYRTNIG